MHFCGRNKIFQGGLWQNLKWANFLEMGQMSFCTAEQRPGVKSIAILIRTNILSS